MRLDLPITDGASLAVQMGYLQPTRPNIVNVLLDFDFTVRRDHNYGLWDQIETLRDLKDDVFFASITDRMRRILDADNS